MPAKPSYAALERRIKYLENEIAALAGRKSTNHVAAKETLQECLAQYASRVEVTSDWIWEVDHTGAYIYTNSKCRDLLGYGPEEIIGKTPFDFMPAKEGARVGAIFDRAARKKAPIEQLENTNVHKDGYPVVLETSGVPIFSGDGALAGFRGVDRDVSARKEAELALRESEERFRTLFADVPAAVQGYDPDGRIHFWNPASEKTYGYTRDEAMGRCLFDLIIPPEMRDEVRALVKDGARTGQMPDPEELQLMRKDGSRVPVLCNHVVLWPGSRDVELYCLDVDLTEQKRLQHQVGQTLHIEALGKLAGGVAHQFNNALTSIIGNLDLLRADCPDNAVVARYTSSMTAAIDRMTRLTAQLLAYARGGRYYPQQVGLANFIRDTLPFVEPNLNPAVRIEARLAEAADQVVMDPVQMQMVLSAVLQNATEAIAGPGYIWLDSRPATVTADQAARHPGLQPGEYVCLSVSDDGQGMDAQTRRRIFEPFFSTRFQGRGLGMAAVYGIVKNHSGWIGVESRPGEGTTVRIYLPVDQAEG
jgi:PAS domain S-box-containing protein